MGRPKGSKKRTKKKTESKHLPRAGIFANYIDQEVVKNVKTLSNDDVVDIDKFEKRDEVMSQNDVNIEAYVTMKESVMIVNYVTKDVVIPTTCRKDLATKQA